jgi:hypothetical protein
MCGQPAEWVTLVRQTGQQEAQTDIVRWHDDPAFYLVNSRRCFIFRLTGLQTTTDWLLFAAVQFACYLLAQQQTTALLLVVRSSFTAATVSIYITIIYLMLGSGALR